MPPVALASGPGSVLALLRSWFSSLPFFTAAVLATCCLISGGTLLLGVTDAILPRVCTAPRLVLGGQFYRLLTSPFVHLGLLHLALNMTAWCPLGSSAERLLGSVQFAWLSVLLATLGGLLHAAAGAALSRSPACAVGLSGLIFSLVVVDAHIGGAPTRSLFGFLHVPSRVYPLALLALLQVLLPGVSLLGHLCGVALGYVFVWGYLDACLLSPSLAGAAERSLFLPLSRSHAFVHAAGLPDPRASSGLPRWSTPGAPAAAAHAAGGGGGGGEPGGGGGGGGGAAAALASGWGVRAPPWVSTLLAAAREAAAVPASASGAAPPGSVVVVGLGQTPVAAPAGRLLGGAGSRSSCAVSGEGIVSRERDATGGGGKDGGGDEASGAGGAAAQHHT